MVDVVEEKKIEIVRSRDTLNEIDESRCESFGDLGPFE